ncbi:ABC transporter substrate-binding protein [Blastococcus sp. SYSU D01042]
MRKSLRLTAAGLAGALLLAGCGSDDEAGSSSNNASGGDSGSSSPAELTFVIASAVTSPKEEVAVVAVGEQMGYFEEENLTVDTVNADGSVAAVQAVAGGNGDITPADAGSILAGIQSNVPVKAVGGLVQNWPWQIATLPGSDITSGEDLEGKKLGVISLASGSAPYARAFIRDAGLEPDSDVELLPVGVGAQAAAALTGGDVDALALYGQAYTVIENSGTELEYLDNPDMFDGIRSLTFAASNNAIEEDPEVYERFLRAAYKSMLFAAANPEAAMRMGYETFPSILAGAPIESRLESDVASLTAWLESATPAEGEPADWSDWGAISDEEWEKTQAYTVDAGQIREEIELDRVWDDSLLEAANDFDADAVLQQAADWTP